MSPGLFGAGDDSTLSKSVDRRETLSEFPSRVPKPKSSGLMEAENMKIPSGLVDRKQCHQPLVLKYCAVLFLLHPLCLLTERR